MICPTSPQPSLFNGSKRLSSNLLLTDRTTLGAPVAQWVKRWPTDLAVVSSSPARGEIISTVDGVPLHTAFHYQPLIVLKWLKYCWEGRKIASHLSIVLLYAVDYRKNFKYWDMYVWENSVDSDQTALKEEQSNQDLHCLPFYLHLLEALRHCRIKLFYNKDNYGSWSGCPNI